MAPGLIDTTVALSNTSSSRTEIRFPEGVKTSGQHNPLYNKLRAFDEFPKEISGPTVWKGDDYLDKPDQWIHHFTGEEIAELGDAADAFIASGIPLTGIKKESFPLPQLSDFLLSVRAELLNGRGFILFKGTPVEQWGNHKTAIAYMGLGAHLGYFVSQNSKGHVLGHVKDLGDDPKQSHTVRRYRTNARQYFHTDFSDFVGLLCLARPLEGGESDICSSHQVYNNLRKERPDVMKLLIEPIWYFDRKGEVSDGSEPYLRAPVYYLETGDNGRVYSKFDPVFIKSLTRFSDLGLIPPLSPAQLEAADVLEETCKRHSLHMILEVGDIQFVANTHVFHARTKFKDHDPPMPKRHLLRLWLALPENEGGWKLPFHDSNHKKRSGVQVNDNPHVANMDPD